MSTRREFGQRLRQERERRGIALRTIADATKVPFPLLAELERGEIKNWPGGLFGRAHFRAYATAVGLPTEPLLREFLRLSGDTSSNRLLDPTADGSRLTLADDRGWIAKSTGMRAVAAAVDFCAVVALSAALARLLQVDLTLTCAVAALTYCALSTMAFGRSGTLWWIGRRVLRRAGTPNIPNRALSLDSSPPATRAATG